MDISFTVLCWNKVNDIKEVIQRYLTEADTYNLICEVLIVDQGSIDGSQEEIKSIQDPRIQLIENPENLGVGHARNQILPLCRGKYIFIGDDDIYIVPSSVNAFKDYLDRHPEVSSVGAHAWFTTTQGNKEYEKFEHVTDELVRASGNYLWAYSLIRREVFDVLKWPDYCPFDGPGWGYDECELIHRMRELGMQSKTVIEFFYRHNQSDGCRTGLNRDRTIEKKVWLMTRWPGLSNFNPSYDEPKRDRRKVAVMHTSNMSVGPSWKLGMFWSKAIGEICEVKDYDFGQEQPGYDLYIYIDDGMPFPYTPPDFARPSVLYLSETFTLQNTVLGDYDARKNTARQFDHVFCAQHNAYLDLVGDISPRTLLWLPHAASDLHIRERAESELEWDFTFIGHTTPERLPYIERAIKEGFKVYNAWKDGAEYPYIVSKSKIGWNAGRFDFDLNMRIFETMAAGAMLLTNKPKSYNGMGELFIDGVHYVAYDGMEDMIGKTKYYLSHPEEREKIAKAGHELVVSSHLYYHRVLRMMGALFNGGMK